MRLKMLILKTCSEGEIVKPQSPLKFLHNSDGSSCIIGSKSIPAQEEINVDTWKVFYQQGTLLQKGETG
jgi:hypothetical protein